MMFWGFVDCGVFWGLRIKVFSGFEDDGALRIRGLLCFEDLRFIFEDLKNMMFWAFENCCFEDLGVFRIWEFRRLWCVGDLTVLVFWRLRIIVFWGLKDYGVIRIWGLLCSECLKIKVFWGFVDCGVSRVWGLKCSEYLRIMVFWGFDDYSILRIEDYDVLRIEDYDVFRILG